MKVLIVANGLPSRIGEIHLYNILKGLPHGHEVTLLYFDRREEWNQTPDPVLEAVRRIPVPAPPARNVVRTACAFALGVPAAVVSNRSAQMSAAIAKETAETEFDAVVLEQLAFAQYGDAVRCRGTRVLFPVDAVSRLKSQVYRAAHGPLAKAAHFLDYTATRRYERRSYGRFPAVLLVSDDDVAYLRSSGTWTGNNLHVLPLAVDLDYFRPAEEKHEALNIVFLGNLAGTYNQDAVLWFHEQVWPRLAAGMPGLTWTIVGASPPPSVQALGREPRVTVTGYVDDFRPYLADASVFVSPLRLGAGVKNRMLQAMAMGKAIVATPLSTDGLAVENNVHVELAETAEEFTAHVVDLLNSPARRRVLGEEARGLVEREHSLEALGRRFISVLEAASRSVPA